MRLALVLVLVLGLNSSAQGDDSAEEVFKKELGKVIKEIALGDSGKHWTEYPKGNLRQKQCLDFNFM